MRHDAPVLAAAVSGLEIDSQIGGTSCHLDFPHDIVSQLFLKRSSSCTPLCDSSALAESDQLLCSNDPDIGNSDHWLMMVAAHAVKLATHNQHSIITAITIIGKCGIIRSFLISSNHQLVKVHLSDPVGSFLAVGIIFTVNEQSIKHLFKSLCCFLNKFLDILP